MSVKILKASSFPASMHSLIDAIDCRTVDINTTHLLLVPEKYTLVCEQLLCRQNTGFFDVMVMSTGRLWSRECGKGYLCKEGAIMMLREILEDLDLKCFNRSKKFRGFSEKVYEAIIRLMEGEVTPDMLNTSNGDIRLEDIKLIYQRFLLLTSGYHVAGAGRTAAIIDKLREVNFLANTHVYVGGFDVYTAQESTLLRLMEQKALSVTYAKVCEDFNFASRNISQGTSCTSNKNLNKPIELYPSSNSVAALKAAARRIREHAYNGVDYGNMGIICSPDYYARAKRILGEYQIPFYIDNRIPLKEHPLTGYLLNLFALKRYTKSGFISLSKSVFSGISLPESDVFENYCNRYCIDYLGFSTPFTIEDEGLKVAESVRRRLFSIVDGFNNSIKSASFSDANKDGFLNREGKTNANSALGDSFNNADDFSDSFNNTSNDLGDSFNNTSNDLSNTQSQFTKVILRQLKAAAERVNMPKELAGVYLPESAYNKIAELLMLLQNQTITKTDRKIEMLIEGIEAASLGALPQYLNSLMVGGAELFRLSNLKFLAIIGFNEGVIPPAEQSVQLLDIITENSNTIMAGQGETLTNNSDLLKENEVLRAIMQSDEVFLGYNTTERPSQLLYEVKKGSFFITGEEHDEAVLFSVGKEHLTLDEGSIGTKDALMQRAAMLCCCKSSGKELLIISANDPTTLTGSLSEVIGNETEEFLRPVYCHPNLKEITFKNNEVSASRLQEYFACPYRHFIKYCLRPKERERGEVTPIDIGSVIHKIAEEYAKSGFCEGILNKIIDKNLSGGKYTYAENQIITARIKAEAQKLCTILSMHLKAGIMRPLGTEIALRGERLRDVDIGGLKLTGSIDYADCVGKHVRIVDYKTGYINADKLKRHLYYGLKIQLMLYMQALIENGCRPAAMVYFKFYDRFLQGKNIFEGVYNNDIDVIKAMDKDFTTKSNILTAKLTKNKITGKGALSEDEINNLCLYAKNVSAKAVSEILSGFIMPLPYEDDRCACDYCPFVSCCGGGIKRTLK